MTIINTDLEFMCSSLIEEFSLMANGRILITGGAGFLGYYLTQSILFWNRNHDVDKRIDVTVIDNFQRGAPNWLMQLQSELEFRQHDITLPLPADVSHFNYLIHAASIASPTYYRLHPIETMDANVNGLRHLLNYCVGNDAVKAALFFSSSEIYGDPPPDKIPTTETYRGNISCTGPRACYDESKRYGETLCVNFARHKSVPVKIVRPFNNYGPGLKISDRRVIPDFAQEILSGRDLVVLSDGTPTRTFCYVADAVVGYYKVLVRGAQGESYNIGVDAPEISVSELATKMVGIARELFGYTGAINFRKSSDSEYLTDNPVRRCPDLAKAKKELNYSPKITIDEGLRRTMLWYRDNFQAQEG